MGAADSRSEAEYFYELSAGSPVVPQGGGAHLSERFARLDRLAGRIVLDNIRAAFALWYADAEAKPWQIEPVFELAYLLARWYLLDEAVELLLDAALADLRPRTPIPDTHYAS